jgi:hypothetical protein
MYCFSACAEASRAFRSDWLSGMDRTRATPFRLMIAGREKNTSPSPNDWGTKLDTVSTACSSRKMARTIRTSAAPNAVVGSSLGLDNFQSGSPRIVRDSLEGTFLVAQSRLPAEAFEGHARDPGGGDNRHLAVPMLYDDVGMYVLGSDAVSLSQASAETGGIQSCARTNDSAGVEVLSTSGLHRSTHRPHSMRSRRCLGDYGSTHLGPSPSVSLQSSRRDFVSDWLTPAVIIVMSAEQQSAKSPVKMRVLCEKTSAFSKSWTWPSARRRPLSISTISAAVPEISNAYAVVETSIARTSPRVSYCASIHLSEPTSLTDTFEKKIRAGLPSAVPRWSVEIRRGPAFL